MFNQPIDHYLDALKYLSVWLKARKMCDKSVSIHPSVIQ